MTDSAGEGGQAKARVKKVCFIAAPIGAANSDLRRRSDLVKKYIIDEVLEQLGYETRRSDQIDRSGEITTQIVSDLIEADLLIADLTGHNANVFYELGVRHSFRLPYIQLIEEGEDDIPFDVRQYRTVFLNHQDLESVDRAKTRLRNMVTDIEEGGEIQSPVTKAADWQQLQHSADPEARGLGEIAVAIERIDARLRRIETYERPGSSEVMTATLAAILQRGLDSGELTTDDMLKLATSTGGIDVLNLFFEGLGWNQK